MSFKLFKNILKNRAILNYRYQARWLSTANDKKLSYLYPDTNGLKLIGSTINECLIKQVETNGDKMAFKFCLTKNNFTYKELKQRIDEIAQNLLNLGFQKGDRLAIILPNIPEMLLLLIACASTGIISVVMNPAYQQVEIEYMLKKTGSKGVVILDNLKTLRHYDILTKICPELETSRKGELNSKNLPNLKHVILVPNRLVKDTTTQYKGTWSIGDFEKYNKPKIEVPYVDIDDTFAMLFTSGTTGLPKATPITHHTIVNSVYLEHNFPGCQESNRKVCVPIPIFHLFGLAIGMTSSIVNGIEIVYPHLLPDTLATIKAIHNEKCTALKGAPVIFIDLINHPELKNHDISSLESMIVGASVVPKDLLLRIKRELKLKHIIIGYGMTETGCVGSATRVSDADKSEKFAYESIGQGFPFVEAKIVDPKTRKILPINTDGELCMRGYNIMAEYWDEPVKTAESIDKHGWFYSGDICSMDENGYLYFKTRAKEMAIRGGVNIYPAEIERFLRTNDKIFDCYVVGVPDKRFGEELCAWIKLKPNMTLTEEEIKKFCEGQIAYYKVPKYIKFVDSFPINATGKVQKFKMAEQSIKDFGL